jgi:mono/diheme cytochrome c family protein
MNKMTLTLMFSSALFFTVLTLAIGSPGHRSNKSAQPEQGRHTNMEKPQTMRGGHAGMAMSNNNAMSRDHWSAPQEAIEKRNPIPASGSSVNRGKRLFQSYCVTCHGPQGRGDGPVGASLIPKPADLTAMAGAHKDGDFAWKIATGRGAMPGWKSVLKENQIWDLVNFIQTLKK